MQGGAEGVVETWGGGGAGDAAAVGGFECGGFGGCGGVGGAGCVGGEGRDAEGLRDVSLM